MKYMLVTLMSIIILTFVACSDDVEDTAAVDTAVQTDATEGEGEGSDAETGEDAGNDAAEDLGGSENE